MGPATSARKTTEVAIPIIKKEQENSQEFENNLHSRIAQRAHRLYEQHGAESGHDLSHWLQAESELMSRVLEVRESGSWLTVNVPLPNVPPDALSVLMERDRALICAETREAPAGSEPEYSQRRFFYHWVKWPNEVDPSTASAYLKDGVVTLTAKNASPGDLKPGS